MKNKKTGYASIDRPYEVDATFFEKNPIIPNLNIYNVIKYLSLFYRGENAVDCLDVKVNYQQLIDDAATISLALKELGVKKGDIVTISMPNYYQALAMFLASNRIGAITTFLNSYASLEETLYYLNMFESNVFINFDKSIKQNRNIKKNSKVRYVITLSSNNINNTYLNNDYRYTSNNVTIDYNSLGDIAKFQKQKFEKHHGSNLDSLILFTSGTTGKPKSVVLTNKNILAAEIYAKNTSHTENIDVKSTLVCVPFSYPYGLVTSALTSLLWGKNTILAPNICKDNVAYFYSKNPNIVFGSPAFLDLTMNNISYKQDLSSVTHFISGGDFMSVGHAQKGTDWFANHGASVEIGNGFGNAETVSIGSTPIGVPLKPETAGRILVGTDAIIVNPDNMKEQKYNKEGLLLVSGKHLFKEYFKDKKKTSESIFEIHGKKYYNTGTLGKMDEDGYFIITGRQSRFYIMSSLNKVYLDNIQNIISNIDCVDSCAVVKVPDKDLLYVNKAYIVLNDKYGDNSAIKDYIIEKFNNPIKTKTGNILQLKQYEIPTYLEFVPVLPRKQGSEKIDYDVLENDALKEVENNKVYVK